MGDPEASNRYLNETNLSSSANPLVPQCSVGYLALFLPLRNPKAAKSIAFLFVSASDSEDFAVALKVAESFLEPSNCEHHAILRKAHHLCKI